jgi:hypothetical protein
MPHVFSPHVNTPVVLHNCYKRHARFTPPIPSQKNKTHPFGVPLSEKLSSRNSNGISP